MDAEDHPLGFKRYILLSLLGFRLRLHVWRGAGHDGSHDHKWWFVSVPLFGRFIDTRYVEADGNLVKINVLDRDGVRDNDRMYHAQGHGGLAVRKVYTRFPFVPYFCPRGEIHSYVPYGGGLHVSLVFIGRPRGDRTTIWRHRDAVDVPLEEG